MFAALFIPDFPVEAIVRAAPELREHAVAILEGTPPLLHVVACNERARQAGVEAGMTKLEAEGRLSASVAPGSCPAGPMDITSTRGWAIRRRSPAQEAAAHAALIDCACAFSPRVEDDPATPDTVVLDLSGLDRLFGPPATIARELAQRASGMGLETHVAVAANVETATYAARGFAGITVLPPGKEAERLGPLAIQVLLTDAGAEDQEILETLARWGVRDFRAFAALPGTAVAQRLGAEGVRLQRLARGEGSRPLLPAAPPLEFEEAVELEYPVALLEPLAFVLNGIVEQLCARLSARALSTNELRLRLCTAAAADDDSINAAPANFDPDREEKSHRGSTRMNADQIKIQNSKVEIARTQIQIPNSPIPNRPGEYVLRLPVPMLEAKTFLKLLQLELHSRPPQAPVEKVLLRAEPVQPRFLQGGLFLPTAPEPEKLELTLARIKAVVGRDPNKQFGISDLGLGISRQPAKAGAHTGENQSRTGVGRDPNKQFGISDLGLGISGQPAYGAASGKSEIPNPTSQISEACVGSAELLDTHRPDAFRMKKFVPPTADDRRSCRVERGPANGAQSETRNMKLKTDCPPERAARFSPRVEGACVSSAFSEVRPRRNALRRIRPPLAAQVQLSNGTPASISISDFRFSISDLPERGPQPQAIRNQKSPIANVLWAAGPWHESGDWWSEHPWQHETWDVAVQQNGLTVVYRIYRDAPASTWWVEAEYD